jgi:serine phosphatase RsbU (regulator of sigma subunit)
MTAKKMIRHSGNILVKAIVIISLLFCLAAIVHGIFGLKVSFMAGRFGFNYQFDKKQSVVKVDGIHNGFPAELAGLKEGDAILAINGELITAENLNEIWGKSFAGTSLTLQVKRGETILDITITRKLLSLFERLLKVLFLIVLPLVMTAYVLVGCWGIFKNPSFVTNLIALVCVCFSFLIYTVNISMVSSPISKYLYFYPIKNILVLLGVVLGPPIWTLLFLYFPQKNNHFHSHKFIGFFLIFILPAGLFIQQLVFPNALKNPIQNSIILIYMTVYISAGILILTKGAKLVGDVLKKRQYRMILFGIKYGSLALLSGLMLVIAKQLLFPKTNNFYDLMIYLFFLITQVCGLILPFTFLNSFFQNKILETESALKRRLRYIGASTILFFLYLLTAFFIGRAMIIGFNVTDQSLVILFVLVLSITFTPLNTRILHWLEIKLYPEKNEYKKSLHHLIRKMAEFIETQLLLDHVRNWIENTMNIHPIYAIAWESPDKPQIPWLVNSKNSVIHKMKKECCFFWDEISDASKQNIELSEREWAIRQGISVSIPLIHRGELMGIFNIGKKKNQEDFNGDDLEIFREAAEHTAMALKNIKLHIEFLEKKRMDKELEMARSIQRHLMPDTIPPIAGLQVEGVFIPCNEVGGDYFDVIQLNDVQTALVIADVSGKGVGAALLMANLQASLKMALLLSVSMEELLSKMNNLICENSLPSQFITFFIGIWDNQTKEMCYINAGHNAPLIIGNTPITQSLNPSGIAFGILANQKYKKKCVALKPGDLLFIYSDGVEEYFDANLQEYGLKRMEKVLLENKAKSPREIGKLIMQDLADFSGGEAQSDDLTFIVAKITD